MIGSMLYGGMKVQKTHLDKIKYTILSFAILSLIICSLFSGCLVNIKETIPNETFVQEKFSENYGSICVITKFLTNSGYNSVYIRDASGTMFADLQERHINNNEVLAEVTRLLDCGEYIHIYKTGNTICFLQWKGIRDIGCGIAYTISQESLPEVDYATEFRALSEPGWFYYSYNYNEWRNQQGKEQFA